MLNLCPHSEPGVGKAGSFYSLARGSKSAKIIHVGCHLPAERKKARFQAHLGKGDIVIYPFDFRFFNIDFGQIIGKAFLYQRIGAQKEI